MRNRFMAFSTFCLLALVVLSACGSSTAGNASGPITVGELFPMTGREPFVGQWFLHGAKVAIYDINKNGGCDGHQLNPVLGDTGGDAVDAVTALKKLQTNSPTFILGPSSLSIEGVINQFDPAHLPDFVEGGTTQVDHMTNKYVFRTTSSDSTLAIGMAYYAIQKGYTKAALFFESTSNAQGVVPPLMAAYQAHGGTITDNESVTPHESSYRTEIEKMFATHPQAVFIQTDPQTASTFFSEVAQLGDMNVPFIATDAGADPSYVKAMGAQYAAQYLTGMAGAPPAGPAWSYYTQQYQKVWNANKPVELSQNTYDAAVIACLAMTAAKSTDPTVWVKDVTKVANGPGETVSTYAEGVKALKAGKSINYSGASGNDDFNQYHNVFTGWDIVQWNPSISDFKSIFNVPATQINAWAG